VTAVLLVSVYLFALACFLGLDVLGKVPPNLYAVVLAGVGALAGVTVVVGLSFEPAVAGAGPARLWQLGVGCAAAAVGGGLVAVARLARGFRTPARPAASNGHGNGRASA
jgi:NAD(P) transhydrogenase subunit alpha